MNGDNRDCQEEAEFLCNDEAIESLERVGKTAVGVIIFIWILIPVCCIGGIAIGIWACVTGCWGNCAKYQQPTTVVVVSGQKQQPA